MERGVSSDLGTHAPPTLPPAVGPEESIVVKQRKTRGLTRRNCLVFGSDPKIHPVRMFDVRITGKKLETRLDLTLWIIESLVGNP
jgi:hypothetical protein